MNHMFYRCSSLASLDLSNFDTSKVSDMSYMFANCNNLKFLDISGFNEENKETSTYDNFFNNFISPKGTIIVNESILKKIENYIPFEWKIKYLKI